jgi:hypothetical protein
VSNVGWKTFILGTLLGDNFFSGTILFLEKTNYDELLFPNLKLTFFIFPAFKNFFEELFLSISDLND